MQSGSLEIFMEAGEGGLKKIGVGRRGHKKKGRRGKEEKELE